jgi:hypothetical protein
MGVFSSKHKRKGEGEEVRRDSEVRSGKNEY